MATLVHPAGKSSAYRGLPQIFEFTNDDGDLFRTNCGLAAAATYLTHYHLAPVKNVAEGLMPYLEKFFPPDILFGFFGTSRRRVTRICQEQGVKLREIGGEDQLRACLDQGCPVIVMLGMVQGRFLNLFDLPGGHWMVAYGYDEENVYLTNYGTMTWDEFRHGWDAMVPRLINMRRRGLVKETAPR